MTYGKEFDAIIEIIESLKKDAEKFYIKEQNAAGSRIRKGMQDLKHLAFAVRVEVQATKSQRPKKVSKNGGSLEKARAARLK